MKKTVILALALALALASNAQLGNKLKNAANRAKNSVIENAERKVNEKINQTLNTNSGNTSSNSTKSAGKTMGIRTNSGKTYYVCPTGSNRADGLTPSTAKKDIQKVLNIIRDNGEDGAVVKVAEGNYLGELDAGYIEIYNCISLIGGWNSSFTECDPHKHITRIQPTAAQKGTNGSKALITISKLDDIYKKKANPLIIDGFCLDMGLENDYKPADPSDPACGCPEGCETGRMLDEQSPSVRMLWSNGAVNADVIIRNCMFLNANNFGIMMSHRGGNWEIYNNVFVSCRYSSVRIDGWDKNGQNSYVDFHHNTVAFSWCRTKTMEDMGYGFEFMSKVNADVHHNIFACNNYAALARTHADSDKNVEARRKTSAYNNIFFLNAADLQLPANGGGKWLNVACRNFEDVDEKILANVDGNFELKQGDNFVNIIDKAYLKE